jgi:hypothetical protein
LRKLVVGFVEDDGVDVEVGKGRERVEEVSDSITEVLLALTDPLDSAEPSFPRTNAASRNRESR